MSNESLNGSHPPAGAYPQSAGILRSGSRARRSSALTPSRSIWSWLAVTIAVFGLLVGGAVLDREQRLQLQEVIHG